MESKTTFDRESERVLMWSLPLLAVLCVAGLALVAHATLTDDETPPLTPQYTDWDHAYSISVSELGYPITVRRDGQTDPDYLKIPFLAANDLVTVNVEQNSTMAATVDYWCSDPGKFPIYENFFVVNKPTDPFEFQFQFAAIVSGSYYIHTGNGFGSTWINLTITRVPSPPSAEKDTNNKPADIIQLTNDVPHTENGGLPWDPSDFFYINIQPTVQNNKYLSIHLSNDTGTKVDWELYDPMTVQRPSREYTSDQLIQQDKRDNTHPLVDWPVPAAGNYIVRIWVREGYGSYTVTLGILTYPNDANNSIEEAYQVYDPRIASYDHLDADVNLSFDMDDYDKIYLAEGQPLWVKMKPDNGPADLFLQDAEGNQIGKSDNPGLEEEHIYNFRPDEAGFYYILVSAVFETESPPTVTYTIWIWINYAPNVVRGTPTKYSMPEDVINNTISVANWFEDKDGDAVTYDLDASFNSTRIEVTLLSDGHLRIAPRANQSAFSVKILVNATDTYGLMVNHTVTITITPVNDAPYVDVSEVPSEITIGEDLVKSGVNVTRPFRDIDDDYGTWRFSTTTTTHVKVELDPITWLATFTPLVKDWFGTEHFNVTCTDSGGLTATIMYKIVVFEINDPPVIANYLPQITMLEEGTFTYNLEDAARPAFRDIEGRPLTYAWANNGSVMVSVENGVISLTGIKDYSGIITGMQLWAIDDLAAKSANMTLLITVNEVDDAPVLKVLKATATVQEGQGVKFEPDVYYKLIDPDSQAIDLGWKWFVNDVEVPPSQISDRFAYEYVPQIVAEKDRTVTVRLQVTVTGATGGDNATFTVSVTNKNAPPNVPEEPAITPALEKDGSLLSGKKYTFTTNATDIDGDTITYEWFLDETTSLGTGPSITVSLATGSHKITVKATDPSGASSTKDIIVNVLKPKVTKKTPGYEGVAIVAALAVVAVALVALKRRH